MKMPNNIIMRYFKFYFIFLMASLFFSSCEKKERVITAIHLESNNLILNAGEEYQFVVIHEPSDLPVPNYKWNLSPQEEGGEISETGLFKAIIPGHFQVEVITTDVVNPVTGNYFVSSCDVRVEALPISSIKFSNDSIAMELGKDTLLSCIIEPKYASMSDLKWKSSDESIAIVNDGRVEAKNIGQCTITAYYTSSSRIIEAECVCNVTPPSLDKISLEENDFYFNGIGEGSVKLNVYCYPEGSICPKLLWSTSDANVVKVDREKGWLTAVSTGICTITATSEDGKFAASYEMEVRKVRVEGLFFADDKEFEVAEGGSIYLDKKYLYISPYNASNKNFKLEQMTGHGVAKISSDGKSIVGLQEGIAYFKATSEEGGYTDVCKVVVLDKIVANVNVEISLSGFASIAGYVTANLKCQVWNYNTESIQVTGLEVLPSSGGGNSNSAYFKYNGEIEYLRSKYWLNSFQNIYNPYYMLHFMHKGKIYTKKIK